jgi:hypothetical protein
MRHPQRMCTPEFKHEAVRLLETSGKSGIQIAKDLGISDTIVVSLAPGNAGARGHRVSWQRLSNGA